jgi:hypothetical protein
MFLPRHVSDLVIGHAVKWDLDPLQFFLSCLVMCNHLSHLFLFFLSPLKCVFAFSGLLTIRSTKGEKTWEKKLERIQILVNKSTFADHSYMYTCEKYFDIKKDLILQITKSIRFLKKCTSKINVPENKIPYLNSVLRGVQVTEKV